MVNVWGKPVQPLADGVTVMVAVTGAVPVFTAVKAGIFPLPLAARPMEGAVLVQLYALPATAPVNDIAFVVAPLHNV